MLTERRKGDRVKMAAMVEALCKELGASFAINTILTGPRELWFEIVHGDARVSIDFSGTSNQPDVYCMPWNTVLNSDARFTLAFGRAVGEPPNPYHRRKCMGFAHGIDDLLKRLRLALECIKKGEAFEPRALEQAA